MNFDYCNGMIYVIKKGDTLYSISRKYNVPLAMILRSNPYADIYNLKIGDEICIPQQHVMPNNQTPEKPQKDTMNGNNTENRTPPAAPGMPAGQGSPTVMPGMPAGQGSPTVMPGMPAGQGSPTAPGMPAGQGSPTVMPGMPAGQGSPTVMPRTPETPTMRYGINGGKMAVSAALPKDTKIFSNAVKPILARDIEYMAKQGMQVEDIKSKRPVNLISQSSFQRRNPDSNPPVSMMTTDERKQKILSFHDVNDQVPKNLLGKSEQKTDTMIWSGKQAGSIRNETGKTSMQPGKWNHTNYNVEATAYGNDSYKTISKRDNNDSFISYVVRNGDTIQKVVDYFSISTDEFLKYNRIDKLSLKEGMIISIPNSLKEES